MRWIALMLLGWVLAGASAAPAMAQAWLTVGGADGSFRIEMPVPFDLPSPEIRPDGGRVTFACVYQTAEVSLRFEVLDAPMTVSEQAPEQGVFVRRIEDDSLVLQTRVYVVGHRTFRLVAISTPELEGDAMIHRFLTSVRLLQ
jgi:hypothetical protein